MKRTPDPVGGDRKITRAHSATEVDKAIFDVIRTCREVSVCARWTAVSCWAGDSRSSSPLDDEHRRDAVMAFLGARPDRPFSATLAVDAMASARQAVAAHLARGASIDEWLASETRIPGVRENAAVLAVMGIPEHQHPTAHETYLDLPADLCPFPL